MRALATTRLFLAIAITLAVLPYAWGRVLVYPMAVGGVEPRWIGILAAGIAVVFALTWRLGPTLSNVRWTTWAIFGLIISWVIALGIVVLLTAVPTVSVPALIALFVPATLWAPWLAWLGYSGRPPRWKMVTSAALVIGIAPFPRFVRVAHLSGDNRAYFDWRNSPRHDYIGPSEEAVVALPVSIGSGGADDSPQFLGPSRNGVYPHVKLADWSATPPREVWRRPIGPGWSSFAVVGGYCFTQEQRDDHECVCCYRVSDGASVWRYAQPGRFTSSMGGDGPRATPTVASGRVFAVGALGHLVCLDAANGKLVWATNLIADCGGPNLMHGVCASPLVDGERVIVCPPSADGPCLAAYHRDTGDKLWTAGLRRASYSSPTLWDFEGRKQILLVDANGLSGHDGGNGQPLWHFPWSNSDEINCAQPIADAAGAGTILVTTGYGTGAALVRVKRDGPDRWVADHVWKRNVLKTKFTSAVMFDDYAYGLDDGILMCVNAATGKTRWKDGRYRHGQVIIAGDKLIVQAENGEVALVEASPAGFKELGRIRGLLNDDGSEQMTWNVPVLSGKLLLIRNNREAACYEVPTR